MSIALIKREKRIRRRMLSIVDEARAAGGVRGRMLADILESLPEGLDGDMEALRLATDLVNLGLLSVADTRTLKSQRESLDYLVYRVTAKGTGLLAGVEPVCPLVEDDRIG